MKQYINIFLVAATLGLGATSCSDYLEEDNKAGATADSEYNTSIGMDGLVSSAYSFCRGWWGKEPSLGLAECGTDLFYYGYDNKQKSLLSYDLTSSSYGFASTSGTDAVNNNPCLDQYWEMLFAGVDVCNNVLKYAPKCSNIDANTENVYEGDAYFLRALYYSQIVATWGPVPYNDVAFTSTNTSPVRLPESVVYGKILDDLKTSMTKYQAAGLMQPSQVKQNVGRACYYAAEALYARVALYAASWLGRDAVQGHSDLYAEARDAAKDVIANSGASFYTRYSDTWNMNNEDANKNKENLFATHYSNDVTSGFDNCVPYRFCIDEVNGYDETETGVKRGTYNSLLTRRGYGKQGGSASLLMFVSLWNNGANDLGGSSQKNTSVFWRVAAGKTTIQSASTGENVDVAKYYSPYGRGFTRYLPSLYLWRTLDACKATDQRYNATLLTYYNIPKELADNVKGNYPEMANQTFKDYEEAYDEDGNYFNGGGHAILYSALDGDSEEGQALQAEAKNKYRLQFATGGDIPVYTSNDLATALPTSTPKAISDVYGDNRYNAAQSNGTGKISGMCSFPGIKKFLDDQYDSSNPTGEISGRDIMVLRLAEMYLIEAEAELYTDGASTAQATLDVLRSARAIEGQDNSFGAVYPSMTFNIDAILQERAIELCGEYQRWFDLKRTHKLLEYVQSRNAQASHIALKHYYRPIPQTQFESVQNRTDKAVMQDANGVLQYTETDAGFWQNPGY